MGRQAGSPQGTPALALPLGELAAAAVGEILGDREVLIHGIRSLEQAGPGELSFLTHAAYRAALSDCRAAALLIPRSLAGELGGGRERPLLVADDPSLALARLIALFHPADPPAPGIHPTAVVAAGCEIHDRAHLGPYVVVGEGSRVGPGAALFAHVVVGRRCEVGTGAVLHPHVVLYDRTRIGDRVVVHAGAVLGADGFGYATHGGEHVKVPQVGRTVVEPDVEIGALSAVDRAALEETRIGAGSKIDNLVQVGHNVEIGRGCILCGQAGIAGSARLGDHVVVGGQSGVSGHLQVGSGVQVAGKSAVFQAVEGGRQVAGVPAIDLAKWRRQALMIPRLGELLRRLRAVEKRLGRPRKADGG